MMVAYFAPMGGILDRIGAVGRRGRARVMIPAKSDNHATVDAARSTYARLLKRGVEIFEYQPTKLHSKLLVMDDVVHIGSSNFDLRSLYLNMEMMLRVEDPEFAQMMRNYFEHELGESLEITPAVYKERATLLQRLKWRIVLVPGGDARLYRDPASELQRLRARRLTPARARPRTASRAGR